MRWTTTTTELYERTIAYDYGDAKRNALMKQVWAPTPWMVDAFTGDHSRDMDMRDWCHKQFGPECLPIHGYSGEWQRGGVTIDGWTWYGFAREEQLQQFLARWPPPDNAGNNRHEPA